MIGAILFLLDPPSGGGSSQIKNLALAALVVAGAAFIVGLWVIKRALSRKRTQALQNTAVEIGFTFAGNTRPPYLQTALFSKGQDHEFENIMTGDRAGLTVRLFDYSFVVRGGKSEQTYTQTVATFSRDGVSLPYFELRPANLLDKAWDAVAHKNIHFETDPEFARRYVLQGALPEKVRELFTPGLTSFVDGLDSHQKWHVEGVGSTLVIYRASKKVAPEQMRDFLEQTATIATSFFSFAGTTSTDTAK